MNTKLGVRITLFAAPLLASMVALAAATRPAVELAPAESAAPLASNCTYYNNAAHTQVVGQFGYDCCNNRVAWGKKTQFSVCGGCFPCIPPPP